MGNDKGSAERRDQWHNNSVHHTSWASLNYLLVYPWRSSWALWWPLLLLLLFPSWLLARASLLVVRCVVWLGYVWWCLGRELAHVNWWFTEPALHPQTYKKFMLREKHVINHNTRLFRFNLHHNDDIVGLPIGQHMSMKYAITSCIG